MADKQVCIGDGLTTSSDDLGNNLVFNVGDASWQFSGPGCGTALSGDLVFCDDATGTLYGPPEKYFFDAQGVVPSFTTTDIELNNPAFGTVGSGTHTFGPSASGTFTNPSKCLPMNITITSGVAHVRFQSNQAGVGFTKFFIQPRIVLTGGIVDNYTGGHVQYAYGQPATVLNIDLQGSLTQNRYLLAAGASFNYKITGEINVSNYVSSGIIQNPIFSLRVEGSSV